MMIKYFILLIFYINSCISSDDQEIDCEIRNNLSTDEHSMVSLVNGSLKILFLRSNVAVYKYENLTLVNVLIDDVNIKFNGTIRETSNNVTNPTWGSMTTTISGSANITLEDDILFDCNMELEVNKKQKHEISESLQKEIFHSAKSCLDESLSSKIGKIEKDDYLNAENEPHDFGDQSVPYLLFLKKFPNLQKTQNNNVHTLQTTVNIITDVLIAGIISFISGKELGTIEIPNHKEKLPGPDWLGEKFLKFENGTFSGLQNIHRLGELHIKNSGIHFSISFTVEIPNTEIRFHALQIKYPPVNVNDSAKINIDNIIFGLQVDLNYNKDPCQTSVNHLETKIVNIKTNINHFGILNTVVQKIVDKFIKTYTPNIVAFVKIKIMEVLRTPLETFQCENYRPRLRMLNYS